MSHIPNNAMPHAGPETNETTTNTGGTESRLGQVTGQVSGLIREHPKAAMAAAGAAVAGVVAAAAIPAIRGRQGRGAGKANGKSRKSR